jgi:hypothetical protein
MAVISSTEPRSRRAVLFGAFGAIGALTARSLAAADPTDASASVQLGAINTASTATVIRNASGSFGAIGFVGRAAPANGVGLEGVAQGSNGKGVFGVANVGPRATGVFGASNTGVGVRASGITGLVATGNGQTGVAIDASAPEGTGVRATGASVGVLGSSTESGIGVNGHSDHGEGVLGDTSDGVGVKGEAYSDGGAVKAVYGKGFGSNNNGLVGEASVGTAAYGIWGISTSGNAGVFSGKVLVTGMLSKGGGSFQIDHPLDPETRYLFHSFVESPDMMNVYNGNVVTNSRGVATVKLPRYFSALNRDYRYQLTVIGSMAQAIVAREIDGNSFTIRSSQPGVKVSWQVTGIRKDPFANRNRIVVEPLKPQHERGTYLHPEAWVQPRSKGFQYARLQSLATKGSRDRDPLEHQQ